MLVGQVGEGDPWTDPSLLQGLDNIHLLGPRPYEILPAYLKGFDVGLLPSTLNDYTASMFPMKFFEYLSAGLPIAAVDLPAIRDFHHVAETGTGAGAFVAAVERTLAVAGSGRPRRLEVASAYTYAARTDRMMEILASVGLDGGTTPGRDSLSLRPSSAPAGLGGSDGIGPGMESGDRSVPAERGRRPAVATADA